ncbi:hypothetical protein GCM10009809_10890 [Isoptericola hypogeus]|uniref:Intracellular proteinase inhibitor n=1 Tax=Isoptericola hypogeus TaxID=300179 RepID=A0ABN2J2L3_9MICO
MTAHGLVAPGTARRTPPPRGRRRPAPSRTATRARTRLVGALAVVALLCGVGVLGGYGVGRAADSVRAMLPGADPGLPADKAAPPDPIDLTGPATACRADAVDVGLAVTSPTVVLGLAQVFDVSVRNTGRVPCLIDGAEASRSVTVTDSSGKERVWSSSDCADGETMLLLGPEDVAAHDVRWLTERSAPGCEGEQAALEPGTYRATAALADVPGAESDPVTFTVVAREPGPEPSTAPSATGGGASASPSPTESANGADAEESAGRESAESSGDGKAGAGQNDAAKRDEDAAKGDSGDSKKSRDVAPAGEDASDDA